MAKPLLLLDSNYLCHRAHYSTGELSCGDYRTGVIFGFLRTVIELQDRFLPGAIAFCFDKGPILRELDYPEYKEARREKYRNMTEEERVSKEYMDEQIRDLRTKHIKALGFANIFYQRGYEGDDIIASICEDKRYRGVRKIIVSNDHDLYQLLSKKTSIYTPGSKGTLITQSGFEREFGVTPSQWIDVKAIAGCRTDGVQGIQGVGEKKAAGFLNGSLQKQTKAGKENKAFSAIVHGNRIWKRNRHLVELPYPGCRTFTIRRDNVKPGSWEQFVNRLGMKSLKGKAPK
jgi:DNA polymerase-1